MTLESARDLSEVAVAVLCRSQWLEDRIGALMDSAGVEVQRHRNAVSLVNALQSGKADIAVVEDEGDHFESCTAMLRFRGTSPVPLVAVGSGASDAMACALRNGACDYMVVDEAAHTSIARLLARVAVHRETKTPSSLRLGLCELDSASRALSWPEGEAVLAWREFNIAWLLFQHVGEVVHLRTFSTQVWGRDVSVAKRTIEQHVSRLRQKLLIACLATKERLLLQAVHNVGYRLTFESSDKARAVTSARAHAAGALALASAFSGSAPIAERGVQ